MLDILCSAVESFHDTLPMTGGGGVQNKSGITPGSVPGWLEEVKPFREDASFWHSVWRSAGKPNQGDLHVAMAKSRNLYHYAIHRARRNADRVKAKKLLKVAIAGDIELVSEMKNVPAGLVELMNFLTILLV